MGANIYMKKIPLGISSCLVGENVRYDGANKRFDFVVDTLASHATLQLVCPEMAIGLGVPRETVHLVRQDSRISMRFTDDTGIDLTPIMDDFARQKITSLSHLCGYIVCAKSPSCGIVDTKIVQYLSIEAQELGAGIYTAHLLKLLPWLPVEDNKRLNMPEIRDNFLVRIFALHRLNQLYEGGLSREKLITFHSSYKYLLLAHSQSGYRILGTFVANIAKWDSLIDYFISYRQQFMDLLRYVATRDNHVNTLMHIQGYFKKRLTSIERTELVEAIASYQKGDQSLATPLELLKSYLVKYPDDYLAKQRYFEPYPDELRMASC